MSLDSELMRFGKYCCYESRVAVISNSLVQKRSLLYILCIFITNHIKHLEHLGVFNEGSTFDENKIVQHQLFLRAATLLNINNTTDHKELSLSDIAFKFNVKYFEEGRVPSGKLLEIR